MAERKMLISKRTIVYFALLFVWLPAYSIYSLIPGANRTLLILRLLSSLLILIKSFGTKFRKENFIVAVFSAVEIVSTILYNRGNLLNAFEFCLCIFAMSVFFVNLNYAKMVQFRQASITLSFIYIVGSIVICFSTPSGIRENLGLHFFISSRANTAQTMVCLSSIIFALDYKLFGKASRISFVILALTVVDMIGLHSGQGIIMVTIIITTLLIFTNKKSDKLLKVISPIGVSIVTLIMNWLVISQSYLRFDIITSFITDILNKDVTMTGRDIIYTNIVRIYLGSPWLGYGYGNSIVESELSGFAAGYNSAHNSLFQILIEVGLVGFVFFFALLFYILTQLRKAGTNQSYILYGGIIAFLIGGITSLAYYNIYFYILIMFSVGMYLDDMSEAGRL